MSTVQAEAPIIATIKKRFSVRHYDPLPVSEEDYAFLRDYVAEPSRLKGPFGGTTRVELVRVTKSVSDKGIKLGTYGMIRNPQAYLVGIIEDHNPKAVLDFGYAFEKLILALTARNIGTCWLGGTFTRNTFEKEMELGQNEVIPCITPIGYPKEKQGLFQSAVRYMVKADQKKGWEQLFFYSAFGRPLSESDAGPFAVPVEMVRLGPSASNKQPWRLVVSEDRRSVHFYLTHTPKYSDLMQRTDMGIAMCHFDLACGAVGLAGGFVERNPGLSLPDDRTEYIVTWELA